MTAIPPLLKIMEGKRARPRKAPLTAPKESVLHIAVANTLRDHALPEWQWTHVPSGELRDIRTAVKLKRMGVRRGWPDFILLPPTGRLHCLELKRHGEELTEEQEAFQLWSIRHGVPHSVAFTFDEALAFLDAIGCLRIKIVAADE
jgi:hypothetical protein